jgi:hypothetical protein
VAEDCPGQDTECQTRICVSNVCDFDYEQLGFVLTQQTPGDCKTAICNGNGKEKNKT